MPLLRQQIPAWDSFWSTTLPAQLIQPSISLAALEGCWQWRTWSLESGSPLGQVKVAAVSSHSLNSAILSFQPTLSPTSPNAFGPLSFNSSGFSVAASQLSGKVPYTSLVCAFRPPSPVTPTHTDTCSSLLYTPAQCSLHLALSALHVDPLQSAHVHSGCMCPYNTFQLWQIQPELCGRAKQQVETERAKPDLHLFMYPVQERGGSAVDTRLVLFCTAHSKAGGPHQLPDTPIFTC